MSMAPERSAIERRALKGQKDLLPQGRSVVAVFVRDAEKAGHSHYETFPDVEAAEAFVEARVKRGGKQGFLAFWTLAQKPDADEATRDEEKPEVMAVFSDGETQDVARLLAFPDMQSARAFAQFQSKCDPRMPEPSICWAVPISISSDDSEGVKMSPSLPPRTSTSNVRRINVLRQQTKTAGPLGAYEDQHIDLWRSPARRDNISEVRRVLAVKRWQPSREKSFSGFGSPAGRF